MTHIIDHGARFWRNYHGSVAHDVAQLCEVGFEPTPGAMIEVLAATGRALAQHLGQARVTGERVNPAGSAWSFTDLVAGADCLMGIRLGDGGSLGTNGLVWPVAPGQCRISDPERLALAWGGTRIGQLNRALAARGRSIRTSGSHDGQTLAGAIGTGVHGGAHAQGGFQNHVRGLHIVAGPGRSWWLERRSDPVLADGVAVQLGARLIRDDRLFDSALIHLGGMGVINAVLIDTVPLFVCDVLAALAPVSPAWLGLLAAGDWRALARAQGHDDDPYFMEVTLDPAEPFSQPAMHTLYFKRDEHDGGQCALDDLHLNQPLNCLGKAGPADTAEAAAAPPDLGADIDVAALLRAQFRPCAIGARWGTWGELNGPHHPLAPLYNAAFAVPRARAAEAVQAALAAVAGLPRHFVFTLRPVDGAAGGLAFTRFGTNVVINLDGLGTSLSPVGPMAAAAVRAALDGAGIPYSLHWGKLGGLDAAKVVADFGPARERWRAARRRLLGPAMRQIITNPALVAWGLD
jgi:hypothetical protein